MSRPFTIQQQGTHHLETMTLSTISGSCRGSNGKVESTVKSMKRLFIPPGKVALWTTTSSVALSFNTEMLLHVRTDYPQPKSFMAILSRTPYLHIDAHFHKSGSIKLKQLSSKQKPRSNPPQLITIYMLIPLQR